MKTFDEIDFMSVQFDNSQLLYKEQDFFDYYIKILKNPTLDCLNYRFLTFILERFSKDDQGNIRYSELGEELMLQISRAEAKVWNDAEEEENKYYDDRNM
ncbi:MAG: hypothetical protein IPK25_15185 [Saprospiraceae bacterium]|nr:hypothetical protein [Saprospiraceae bacterium]